MADYGRVSWVSAEVITSASSDSGRVSWQAAEVITSASSNSGRISWQAAEVITSAGIVYGAPGLAYLGAEYSEVNYNPNDEGFLASNFTEVNYSPYLDSGKMASNFSEVNYLSENFARLSSSFIEVFYTEKANLAAELLQGSAFKKRQFFQGNLFRH